MTKKFDRRRFIQTTAAASAAAMFPYIRTSRAAGSLKLAFWDHWVPGANKTMEAICHEWAKKHKVDITIDFITSQGSKLELTIAAEKLAQSGPCSRTCRRASRRRPSVPSRPPCRI